MAASKFAIDVSKFGEKAVRNARQTVRSVVLDLLRKIVIKTPVGNPDDWVSKRAPPGYVGGRLRGNWQTSVGAPASGELPLRPGEAASAEGATMVATWSGEGTAYITNNLPYAEAVEDGHSKQAPAGMVRVTLSEYPGIVRQQARRARGGR